MLFAPVPIAIFQEVSVEELPETNRGEGGLVLQEDFEAIS